MLQKDITILGQRRSISGDPDYLGGMGEEYEPETTALLAALCDRHAVAMDIGANIGLTSLALSSLCGDGAVIAIEPVPYTFELLNKNLGDAGVTNATSFNLAVGAGEGSVSMYVNERNLATSFVVDIDTGSGQDIPMTSLDLLVQKLGLERLDFIKIDVEGCELEVLKGAENALKRFKPIVMLEMNHWCLNIFRGISLLAFRDALLQTFPYVFAVDKGRYLDFSDPLKAGEVYKEHIFGFHYMNIVAGFDRADLIARLDRLTPVSSVESVPAHHAAAGPGTDPQSVTDELRRLAAEVQAMNANVEALGGVVRGVNGDVHALKAALMPGDALSAEARLQAVLDSHSWKMTAPLRQMVSWTRNVMSQRG
jgi:FkbM family methyltransferase